MLKLRSSLVLFVLSLLVVVLAAGGCTAPAVREALEAVEEDAGSAPPKTSVKKDAGTEVPDDSGPAGPDDAAPPEIDAIAPKQATVGSVGPSITVTGSNFVQRSVVQLDGAPLPTSYVSATELKATIPSSKLSSVATLRVSVGTAPPGGGASKDVTFSVVNPTPKVTALTPLSVVAGSSATSLSVTGDDFVQGAKIVFGTTDLTTTFTSKTSLAATIPSNLLGTSGSVPVTVINPSPGGGQSTPISFTVSNPSASISSISPATASIGSGAVVLTVNGNGFIATSTILFNGGALTTTFSSSIKLTATIPAASLQTAGDFPIVVQNQPPGGGVSAPVVFKVQYPAPTASSVSPASVPTGAPATDITVTGAGFYGGSQITFDGAPLATTLVDATHVRATIPAAELGDAGSHQVRVVNPTPGGGTSAALAFSVSNASPTVSTLSPSSVTAGSPDVVITITGTNFTAASSVKANNVNIPVTFLNGTQLAATVPAAQLVNPGTVAITVSNPSPGGGTSTAKTLTVGCNTTGVDYPLGAVGTTTSVTLSWSTAGSMTQFTQAGVCPTTFSSTQQPGRYYVVQNTTSTPFVLSAWGDCSDIVSGDAFLTFYKRGSAPANDNERKQCAFVVTEGTLGGGTYLSPEAGGSSYCPGLTKANNGGLTLGACEKAVIHIQPYQWDSTSFPPPKRLKIKPEAP